MPLALYLWCSGEGERRQRRRNQQSLLEDGDGKGRTFAAPGRGKRRGGGGKKSLPWPPPAVKGSSRCRFSIRNDGVIIKVLNLNGNFLVVVYVFILTLMCWESKSQENEVLKKTKKN